MYFWGIYLVWMLETCEFSLFISAVLPVRWKKNNKLLLMLIIVACCIIPGYLKLRYSNDTYSMKYQISNTIQMVVFIIYVCIFYKEKFWKKALAFALVLVANVLAASFSQLASTLTGIKYNTNIWDLSTFWMYLVVPAPLAVIYAVFALAWNKTLVFEGKIKHILLLIIFPIGQFLISYNAVDHADKNISNVDMFGCISLLMGMIADLVLFYILMNQSEKEQLEGQLREREQLRALEAVRYEELEAKREELAKFRHDYNNWLTTALLLEEQGNIEMAKEMIGRLKEQVGM